MRWGGFPLAALALAACQPVSERAAPAQDGVAQYNGIETRLLDVDLVNFRARMSGAASQEAINAYARCAAVGYALIRGYSFARHVRTSIDEEAGIWVADAVYTISPERPLGLQTLDAEVVAADCAEQGIPTV